MARVASLVILAGFLAACGQESLTPVGAPSDRDFEPSDRLLPADDADETPLGLSRFAVRREDERLVASNPTTRLQAAWDVDGVHVGGALPESRVTLSLAAYGRGARLTPAAPAVFAQGGCRPDGAMEQGECLRRVEASQGLVTEWWENRPDGFEQGFTVAHAAPGDTDEPLLLVLDVTGGIAQHGSETAAALHTPSGEVLWYSGLKAWDATGRTLTTRMEASAHSIVLVVEDQDAVYPVTVDPVVTPAAWTYNGPSANAQLGVSVAGAGDINGDGFADVIVGASGLNRAYVFYGGPNGLPAAPSWISPASTASGQFGYAVAGAGDVNGDGYSDVIVGAYGSNRAYVFYGSAAGLAAEPSWTSPASSGNFGWAVAGAGDVNGDGFADVLVGAPGANRAYLFKGSASGLGATASWTSPSSGTEMGYAVAGLGDINNDGFSDVVIGAPGSNQAYVFRGSSTAAGLGSSPDWQVPSLYAVGRMGSSVAGAGDINGDGRADIILGAPNDSEGGTNSGTVLIALAQESTGNFPTSISTSNATEITGSPGDRVGSSVASAGDVNGDGFADVLIGAAGNGDTYVLYGTSTTQPGGAGLVSITRAYWTSSGSGGFGGAVAGVGDVDGDGFSDVLIGASGASSNAGQVTLFRGVGARLGLVSFDYYGGFATPRLGYAMGMGDYNGDGYYDVFAGVPMNSGSQTNAGAVAVYRGSASGISDSTRIVIQGSGASAQFGTAVASAGDVNGDGFEDMIVGAPYRTNGQTNEGTAYLYYGNASMTFSNPTVFENNIAYSRLGLAVSGAGDLNGDGFDDVIVGAPSASQSSNAGRIYVFYGSASGLKTGAGEYWTYSTGTGGTLGSRFGIAVASAGDVNGDGYADVIVGEPYANSDRGRVHVFYGSPTGVSETNMWTYDGVWNAAMFGYAVSTAGDVNADGYADIIVGAPEYTNGQSQEGAAFVFHGSATGLPASYTTLLEFGDTGAKMGSAVASSDVNGDGYGDVIMGAPFHSNGQSYEGKVYAMLGSPTGIGGIAWTAERNSNYWQMGFSLAGGDIDGDGHGDIAVGAAGSSAGYVIPFFGGENDYANPKTMNARAVNPGTSKLIVAGKRSTSETAFDVLITARTTQGRSQARVQLEVKPVGQEFDGTGLFNSAWADTGVNGVNNTRVSATGLQSGTRYKWRARIQTKPTAAGTPVTSRWYYGGRSGEGHLTHVITAGGASSAPSVPATISATTAEDTPVLITLSATGGSGTYTYSVVSGPANGSVSNVPGGKPTYTPNPDWFGTDSFKFKANDGTADSNTGTVTITVTPVNDRPTAHPQTVQTDENTPVAITLTATDPDNTVLTYQVITSPKHGTLSGSAPNVTYTPDVGWFGTDTFTFTASDGSLTSLPATITIEVAEVNDAPVAQSQTVRVPQGIERPITLVATDTEGDPLTYAVVSQPQHGTLACNGASCTYTSQADFAGLDTFTFKANDGFRDSNVATVTLDVFALRPGNLAPVARDLTISTELDTPRAISLTATDPNGDALTFTITRAPDWGTLSPLEGNLVTYTPLASFDGTDSFRFQVSDGELESNVATVTISVGACRDDAELCVVPPQAERKATCFVAGRSGRFMREVGQTFVVSKSGRPGRVRLPASQLDVFDPAARLLVDVRFTDSAGQIRRDEDATVATGAVVAASLPALSPEFVEFVLHSNGTDASAVLQPGQKYALVLRVEGEANFGLGCSNEDAYAGGQAFTRMARQIAEGQFGDAVFVGDKRDLTFSLTLDDGITN